MDGAKRKQVILRGGDTSYVVKPFGLTNFTGAACWYNSLLQSLLGCEPMLYFLLKHYDYYKTNPFVKDYCEFAASISSVNNGYKLWGYLAAKKSDITRGQQDATEFFTDFIELFNSKCMMGMFTYITRSTLYFDGISKESEKHMNIVMSLTPDAMMNLQKHLNVEIEEIEGYKPYDDKEYTTIAHKVTRLTRAPPILVIMIKNYDFNVYDGTSITSVRSKAFDYPKTLMFNYHTDEYPTITYNLVSLVEHQGRKSMGGGGHYICYSKRGDDLFCFNDAHIGKAVDWPKNNNVYMLLYSTWDAKTR